jgi:hypothetical protein
MDWHIPEHLRSRSHVFDVRPTARPGPYLDPTGGRQSFTYGRGNFPISNQVVQDLGITQRQRSPFGRGLVRNLLRAPGRAASGTLGALDLFLSPEEAGDPSFSGRGLPTATEQYLQQHPGGF